MTFRKTFRLWACASFVGSVACTGAVVERGDAPPAAVDPPASSEQASEPGDKSAPVASSSSAPSTSPAPGEPPWAVDKQGDRIGSKSFRTWIWNDPNRSRKIVAIGALRVGTSVKLKSKTPVAGQGCNGKWYEIEPHGFICTDETTTFDFDSAYWKALATLRPKPGVYPYRYAFSMGAPMYSRVPSKEEQKSAEYDMGKTKRFQSLGKWSEGHERLVTTKEEDFFKADGPIPDFYDGTKGVQGSPWNPAQPKVKVIPAGSGFSYSRVFEAEGRLWLLTPDLFLIPADRAWPYKTSSFKGVELDDKNTLPLAWVRNGEGTPKLKRDGETFTKTDEKWPGRKPVFLTGKHVKLKKVDYYEAKDGAWIADDNAVHDDVSVVKPKTELKYEIKSDERWMEASILGGAHDGLRRARAEVLHVVVSRPRRRSGEGQRPEEVRHHRGGCLPDPMEGCGRDHVA